MLHTDNMLGFFFFGPFELIILRKALGVIKYSGVQSACKCDPVYLNTCFCRETTTSIQN